MRRPVDKLVTAMDYYTRRRLIELAVALSLRYALRRLQVRRRDSSRGLFGELLVSRLFDVFID